MADKHHHARREQKTAQNKRWQTNELKPAARIRKGFRGLWDKLTGTYQRTRSKNERAEFTKGMSRHYQKIDRQGEIKKLYEQEKDKSERTMKNDPTYEPEIQTMEKRTILTLFHIWNIFSLRNN